MVSIPNLVDFSFTYTTGNNNLCIRFYRSYKHNYFPLQKFESLHLFA